MANTLTLPPDAEARVNMLKEHLQACREKQIASPAPANRSGSAPTLPAKATGRTSD